MAKATRITQAPPEEPLTIRLDLTEREARALRVILGHRNGLGTSSVFNSLADVVGSTAFPVSFPYTWEEVRSFNFTRDDWMTGWVKP